jgi:ATP-dependent RNA helicase SUPV3L1/SUV3
MMLLILLLIDVYPSRVEEESLKGDYSKIQPGDCIVAFSKMDLFAIKKEVEAKTGYKCAMVYGQLPPETRSYQARLFNDIHSGYDVLIASDAIGMGLNLNIRRIIFHTALKTVGNSLDTLFISPSHLKQIAGRAGRKYSQYEVGKVTCWQEVDLAYVKAVMKWNVPKIDSAGLFPAAEQIQEFYETFVELLSTTQDNNAMLSNSSASETSKSISSSASNLPAINLPLSKVIERFVQLSSIDNRYFMSNYDNLLMISNWLHTIPLSLADRFVFASAPVQTHSVLAMNLLYRYAALYSMNRPVRAEIKIPRSLPGDIEEFTDLCIKNNVLELYLWLSFRFPTNFIERDLVMELRDETVRLIAESLLERRLRSEYSLAEGYLRLQGMLRKSRQKGELFPMPPHEYSEGIREDYKTYLQQVPKQLRYILRRSNPSSSSKDESNDDISQSSIPHDRKEHSNTHRRSPVSRPSGILSLRRSESASLVDSSSSVSPMNKVIQGKM